MIQVLNVLLQKVVKKDDLLIWNPRDGWEPLCDFLKVPIPKDDIPVANKTADTGYIGKFFQKRLSKRTLLRMVTSQLIITAILYGVPIYVAYKCAKTYLPKILEK